VEWLDLTVLERHRFYPQSLKHVLSTRERTGSIYLGDVN
jgi:hypothetical protein